MVEIHDQSSIITKYSKSLRSSNSFFFQDAILYFSKVSQRYISNHKHVNTNDGSSII
jgi:hypothetical protein